MPPIKTKIVNIIGNIGSGKSTLSRLLADSLKAKLINADDLYLKNPFFPLAVKDRKRWSLASDLWFLYQRVNIINNNSKENKRKFMIVDSGLPMSWIYAHSRVKSDHYTQNEWQLYRTYYKLSTDKIVKVDFLIILTASIKFLLKRIRERRRVYELKYFNKEYLNSLADSINYYKRQALLKKVKVITIDVEKNDLKKQINLIRSSV